MIAVVDTRYSWTSRCEHSPLNILQVILQPITTRKAITRKFSLSKKKITKLQRELQSQFDTSAAVMRKFKEIKKKHDDKKITQKTNNAEAQPENEKKKTEVSQKAEPTKNIEEKAPDKTKLKDAQKQKEKKSPVQKSLDQKTTKKHQSNAKSPQKITQKKKEDKLPVLEKPVEQPKDGKNEQKTITDAKQETEPSLTKAQKKKLQMEYQKQFIQQQRAKEDIKASKPWEIANLPPAIYPEIRNLQNQINQEGPQVPNQVNETVHQRQPPPSNANTTEQPPGQAEGNNEHREAKSENQFLFRF
ncbi:Hypothetical_protein [Hexamita inflata]|uniref:Hypothetical_protein n=1 Tax=Hexamita inflata TaxID=28002 RepID=A0AA86Q9M9_9EUKA|nr:Hypothetical protein HINF_LOCUS40751 [Hexamita inflata]